MKRKRVRISFNADKETLRRMDWLAGRLKISRSEVVELAIQALERRDFSRSAHKDLPHAEAA